MVIIKRAVKKLSTQYYSQKENEVKNKNVLWLVYNKFESLTIISVIIIIVIIYYKKQIHVHVSEKDIWLTGIPSRALYTKLKYWD